MYFNPQKMLPMIFNCFLPFVAFIVLTSNMVQASEWQAYKEIKSAIKESKEMSEQFENSYKNLEFVGIRNDGYFDGDLHKVLKLYAAVLEIDNLDELVTVIDLKRQCETKGGRKYMSEIAECLQKYTPERCKQVYYIQDIRLTIRTMKMKDLYGYEMVNESIKKTNQLYNFLQSYFTYYYSYIATSRTKTYLNKSAYVIVTEYLLEKMKQCEEKENGKFDFDVQDCAELKRMISEKLSNEDFAKSAIDEIYKSVIGSSMQDFSSKMLNATAENILAYQKKMKHDHFDPLTIKSMIQDLYGKEIKCLLSNCLRIVYEKILVKIQEVDERLLYMGYKEYALWLKIKNFATEILSRPGRPEEIVEEFSLCNGKLGLYIAAYILNSFFVAIKEFKYSSNLFRLRDGYKNGSIKIIINQKISKDNFSLIYEILNEKCRSYIKTHDQMVFFNIGKVADLIDDLKEKRKCDLIYQNVNYSEKDKLRSLRSCILLKKKDDEQIDNLRILFELVIEVANNGKQSLRITGDMETGETAYIGYRRRVVYLTVNNNFTKRILQRYAPGLQGAHKTIIVTIKCDILTVNCYFKTYKDKNSIKFKGVKFAETEKRPLWLQGRKDILAKSYSDCQNLASLIQYIQDMRFMPYCSSLIDLYFPRPKNFGVEVFSLTIISDTPCNLNALVSAKLDDCQSTIEKFCIGREGTSTVKLQILMSDYLTRKVSDGHWHELVKHFLHGSGITLSFFEEILDKFIYDENQFDASNEHDIAGVKTCDYKIYVYAILRNNRKTFVSVFGREFCTSFEYCPMCKLLDIFAELVKDPEFLSAEHPLNVLHLSSGTLIHPIAYMFKVLSYPKSNLLKLMHMKLSCSDSIKPYEDLSEQIAHCIHADMAMENSTVTGTDTDSDVENLSIASIKEILNNEMPNLIEKIKQHRDEINRKTKIRVAIYSSDIFNSEDEKEIDELKSILLQEE